jgi:dTDP-4-dehydrorhamnose 3,5-epimerase
MKPFSFKHTPRISRDNRGEFSELYNSSLDLLFPNGIKQISTSRSKENVFRGMHFQYDPPMAKAMRVVSGTIKLIEMDVNPYSPNFGRIQWRYAFPSVTQYYAPAHIARGFLTLEDDTVIEYFQDATFNPATSMTISLTDADLMHHYVPDNSIMSEKDRNGMNLVDWKEFAISKKIFVDTPLY